MSEVWDTRVMHHVFRERFFCLLSFLMHEVSLMSTQSLYTLKCTGWPWCMRQKVYRNTWLCWEKFKKRSVSVVTGDFAGRKPRKPTRRTTTGPRACSRWQPTQTRRRKSKSRWSMHAFRVSTHARRCGTRLPEKWRSFWNRSSGS